MGHYIQAVTIRWFNACACYTLALAQGLVASGHRATIVAGAGSPVLEEARKRGLDVLEGSYTGSLNPVAYLRDRAVFRQFARGKDATLVNVHTGADHAVWALALAGTGIPIVRTSGNRLPPKVNPGAKFLMKRTAGIIASCRTIQEYYAGLFHTDRSRIPVINGGIDSTQFSPDYPRNRLRASLGIPGDAFTFGMVARYSPVKGHRYFFKAAGMVAERNPAVRFVVSGWDAEMTENDIRSMADKAGILDRTVIIGRQLDIRDLLGTLDAGVIASVGSETVCRIAMEYMAMGIPVVGTDINVVPEIIRDGESGFIVPAGDAKAMAAAMEHLLESNDRARSLGQRGRSIIESDYSLEAFAQKTLDAYGSMTAHVS